MLNRIVDRSLKWQFRYTMCITLIVYRSAVVFALSTDNINLALCSNQRLAAKDNVGAALSPNSRRENESIRCELALFA